MHVVGCINAVCKFSSLGDLSSDLHAENDVMLSAGSSWFEVRRGTRPLTAAILISGGDQLGRQMGQPRTGLQHFCVPTLTQAGGHEQG